MYAVANPAPGSTRIFFSNALRPPRVRRVRRILAPSYAAESPICGIALKDSSNAVICMVRLELVLFWVRVTESRA